MRAASSPDADSRVLRELKRVALRPLGPSLDGTSQERLQVLAPKLRQMKQSKSLIRPGMFIKSSSYVFVVCAADPYEGYLAEDTDYFTDGAYVQHLSSASFVCQDRVEDPSVLLSEYISPFFQSFFHNAAASAGDMGCLVQPFRQALQMSDRRFRIVVPGGEYTEDYLGVIDVNTKLSIDPVACDFTTILIVPFRDTVPARTTENQVWRLYIAPYAKKQVPLSISEEFAFQGVQFKVVSCDPLGPARIGPNTIVRTEGMLAESCRQPPRQEVPTESSEDCFSGVWKNNDSLIYITRDGEYYTVDHRGVGKKQKVKIAEFPTFFQHTGQYSNGTIKWSNGSTWTKAQENLFGVEPANLITIAKQREGHPFVVLRESPGGKHTASLPNGAQVQVHYETAVGEDVQVSVVGVPATTGWSKHHNLQQMMESPPLPRDYDARTSKPLVPEDLSESLSSDSCILAYLLMTHTVRLVSGRWLVKQAQRLQDKPLPRRQDLPAEAFVLPEKFIESSMRWYDATPGRGHTSLRLRWSDMTMIALSYGWLRQGHPDPENWHLKLVARLLEMFFIAWPFVSDVGLFWDFFSLEQVWGANFEFVGRDAAANKRFNTALKYMQLIYGHQDVVIWRLSELPHGVRPLADRGWPFFEQAVFSTSKKSACVVVDEGERSDMRTLTIDSIFVIPEGGRERILSEHPNPTTIQALTFWETIAAGRGPPIGPSSFKAQLATKTFTGKGDDTIVNRLYEDLFLNCLSHQVSLILHAVQWTEPSAWHLGDALRQMWKTLDLALNNCSSLNVLLPAMAEGLGEGGQRPELLRLQIVQSDFTNAEVPALINVVHLCPHLEDIRMWENQNFDGEGLVELCILLQDLARNGGWQRPPMQLRLDPGLLSAVRTDLVGLLDIGLVDGWLTVTEAFLTLE